MSIAVVSTLPAPAKDAASGNVADSDTLAAGLDFASLLFGHLAPVTAESIDVSTKDSDLPASDTTADGAPLLVATATIAPAMEFGAASPLPDAGKAGKTTSALSSTLPSTASAVLSAGENPRVEDTAAKFGKGLELAGPSALDDKPAKIAASPLGASRTENEFLKTTSPDPVPKTVQIPNGTAVGNTGNTHALPNQEVLPLSISAPVRDPNWASEFSQKIVWLAGNDKQAAILTLNPPKMGPIEVSLSVDKGHAVVSFASTNSDTREAIDSALPRLREMFASAGISLGQTNVGAQSFAWQAGSGDGAWASSQGLADKAILGVDSVGSLPGSLFLARQGNGLIDIFA